MNNLKDDYINKRNFEFYNMGIPNRQIGQASSTENMLLHEILKKLDQLVKVTAALTTTTTTTAP